MPIGINGRRFYYPLQYKKIVLDLKPVCKCSKWYLYCEEYGYYDTTLTTKDTKSISTSDSYIYRGDTCIQFILNSDKSIYFMKTPLDSWIKD